MSKKHKYKGEEFKRKIAMEKNDINLDELIEMLTDIRDDFKKRGWNTPATIQLLITNDDATKQYKAKLASFWIMQNELTLIAESENPLIIENIESE